MVAIVLYCLFVYCTERNWGWCPQSLLSTSLCCYMTVTIIWKPSQLEVYTVFGILASFTYPNVPITILDWRTFFYVLYSTLLHRPPLRVQCVGGCSDRTQYCYFICHPSSSSLWGGQGLEDKRERFVPLLVFYNKMVKVVTHLVWS